MPLWFVYLLKMAKEQERKVELPRVKPRAFHHPAWYTDVPGCFF